MFYSYDHLDIQTLKDIHKRSPSAHFLVPLGVKALLVDELRLPDDQVTEKQWWESISFDIDNTQVNFICTPAQHNSGKYSSELKPSSLIHSHNIYPI